jgi:hypothetical protein
VKIVRIRKLLKVLEKMEKNRRNKEKTDEQQKKSFGFSPELRIFVYHIGKAHPRAQLPTGVANIV